MTGGPSIVFTPKAVVDQTYVQNSSKVCKTKVGADANQLHSFSSDFTQDGSMTLKLIGLK